MFSKLFQKIFEKKNNEIENSANEEINILDIKNNYIYTRDNLIISIIKINSINMQLFSDKELQQKVTDITSELSGENNEFKFFSISRPVDVGSLIDDLREKLNNTENPKIKMILKKNINETLKLTMTGEVIERQNFMIIYEQYTDNAEKDLLKRAIDLINKFENCDIKAELLDENLLIQLCNSFTNINYVFKEDTEFDEKIPYLKK